MEQQDANSLASHHNSQGRVSIKLPAAAALGQLRVYNLLKRTLKDRSSCQQINNPSKVQVGWQDMLF